MRGMAINVALDNIHCRCSRLDDKEHFELEQNSLAIAADYGFYMRFYHFLEQRGDYLNFAKIYTTLKSLCGESGKGYDDWKGSFSFPFLVEVKKGEKEFRYLLNIFNYRDSLYFGIRKPLQPDDRFDRQLIHQPFEDEFSREEINNFIISFYAYLVSSFRAIAPSYDEFFFNRVDSNGILFGYKDGQFFQDHYDSPEEYKKAVTMLETMERHQHESSQQT
jgi:hypothetical protein